MKKEKNKIDSLLQGIKTEQFALVEENYNPKANTGLSTSLQFKLDQTHKQIGVFATFKFIQNKKIFIKIEVSCHFKIEDETWNNFIEIDNSKVVFSRFSLAYFAMITIGTTRGILFSKTEGTIFSKFIIPIVDVIDEIEEDVSFDLEKV
jgi:hypothetical protein